MEELFYSLDLVMRINAVALVLRARARGAAAAVGAMGFWLERKGELLDEIAQDPVFSQRLALKGGTALN